MYYAFPFSDLSDLSRLHVCAGPEESRFPLSGLCYGEADTLVQVVHGLVAGHGDDAEYLQELTVWIPTGREEKALCHIWMRAA